MPQVLQFFIIIPILGFLISLLLLPKKEKPVSRLAIATVGLHLAGCMVFTLYWLFNDSPALDIKHLVFFKTGTIEIFIDFYFDKITAVYSLTGSLLVLLVAIFSRFYMHREQGFKRFFNTLLLFFTGYNFIIYGGNFETLFIGWEILGLCSFLLIAFYRDRYLPVKNALKVISVYRFGDVCLMLAMWMSHHLWHENITFFKLNDVNLVQQQLSDHQGAGLFIAIMILVAAAVKSAQLPFSSWLPRAMEGPTTSSAIFYGSLSVHIGVFLLMRTYPFWENFLGIKIAIIIIGLLTALIASGIAAVQSSVKTQIAYSSVAQIGIMFIEVALGFHDLALIHFTGNAFLRTYQLLVSPSVLSYLVHDMFFNYDPKVKKTDHTAFPKIKNSLYLLSLKEWNLDAFLQRYCWQPFKWVGRKLNFISGTGATVFFAAFFLAGLSAIIFRGNIPAGIVDLLPVLFSVTGLSFVLKSFAQRGDAIRAWLLVISGQLFIAVAVMLLNAEFAFDQMLLLLSGSIISAVIGYVCLKKIKEIDNDISLDRHHGYTYEQPKLAFVFLVCCLGTAGLPFTPTFIGIDLLFSQIGDHKILVILTTALSFLFIEIAVLRIYARIFMGQHKKNYHPIAYRSS